MVGIIYCIRLSYQRETETDSSSVLECAKCERNSGHIIFVYTRSEINVQQINNYGTKKKSRTGRNF